MADRTAILGISRDDSEEDEPHFAQRLVRPSAGGGGGAVGGGAAIAGDDTEGVRPADDTDRHTVSPSGNGLVTPPVMTPVPHLAEQSEDSADDTLLVHRDADLEEGGVDVDGMFATLDGGTMTVAEAEAVNQEMHQIYAELEAGDTSNQERLFELLRDKIDVPEPPDLRGTEFDFMMCPISLMRFEDPVMACDGHTYERRYIKEHFRNSAHSPMNGAILNNSGELIPFSREARDRLILNITVRKAIDEVLERTAAETQIHQQVAAATEPTAGVAPSVQMCCAIRAVIQFLRNRLEHDPTFDEVRDALNVIDPTIPDPTNRMNLAGYTDTHITDYFNAVGLDVQCFPVSYLHPDNFEALNGRRILYNQRGTHWTADVCNPLAQGFLGSLRTAQGFFYVTLFNDIGELSDGPGIQTAAAFDAAQLWRRQQEDATELELENTAPEISRAILRIPQEDIEAMGPANALALATSGRPAVRRGAAINIRRPSAFHLLNGEEVFEVNVNGFAGGDCTYAREMTASQVSLHEDEQHLSFEDAVSTYNILRYPDMRITNENMFGLDELLEADPDVDEVSVSLTQGFYDGDEDNDIREVIPAIDIPVETSPTSPRLPAQAESQAGNRLCICD